MSPLIYGIDLAKHSFSIYGEDDQGKVLLLETITRSKVFSTLANIPSKNSACRSEAFAPH